MNTHKPFISLVLSLTLFCTTISARDPSSIQHLSGAGTHPTEDEITFTSRASFDPHLLKYLSGTTLYLSNWKQDITLPGPPANSSPRTKAEIEYLHELESQRTEQANADINREIKLEGMRLDSFEMATLLNDSSKLPETKKLLMAAHRDMEIIVFQYKASFDRARPTHLDGSITPSIEVPGHPAYPSGHATQAHLLAYLLCELAPAQSESLISDAAQIAHNREIAGVHYPSDSEAGQLLARQIVDHLLENKSFQRLLVAAQKEHSQNEGKKGDKEPNGGG